MHCARCGFDSPAGKKFCGECGSPFTNRCPSCGEENPPQFKFCGECGTSLTGQFSVQRPASSVQSPQPLTPNPQPPVSYTPKHLADRILAEQAAMEARGGTDGERKTITALFADLKGSTALIEGLDPEEARAIIDPALQLMMDAVHRYEGYVAQALGDGIFALFGAPIAHEDHPQRALYAALRMQEEMRRYSDHLRLKGGTPLYLRVIDLLLRRLLRYARNDSIPWLFKLPLMWWCRHLACMVGNAAKMATCLCVSARRQAPSGHIRARTIVK
jgi:Double zinc ribbon/Adenylate and Guanylate cyclase catalytic domain